MPSIDVPVRTRSMYLVNRALLRMPPSLRRHELCWSRSSVNSLWSSLAQSCIAAGMASAEADYAAALAPIPDSQAKTQGIALGEAAAQAILDLRANDGAVGPFLNFACPQDTDPGEYQCTPGTPFIAFEVWENVTPFVLQAQFTIPSRTALQSEQQEVRGRLQRSEVPRR